MPGFTAPTKGGAGASLTVNDTTLNQGGGPAGPTVTKFYLSVNGLFDASDTLVGSRGVPDLAPGMASSGPTTVTIPPNTPMGAYYLVARADADAAVAETLETNNTAARSIQIGSDLLVSTIGAPPKGAAGSAIVVTETITNQGGGAATASATRFYLSADANLDAGDVLLDGSRDVPDLAAGASSAGSTSVTIPAGSAAGTFYIIAQADADGTISETLETEQHEVVFHQHRSGSHDLDGIGVVCQRPGGRPRDRHRHGDEPGRRDGGAVDDTILFVEERHAGRR